MKLKNLLVVAGVIGVAVYGAQNWTHGSLDLGTEGGRSESRSGADLARNLEVDLRLGFKSRGQWIEEGEDRKIYLLGSIRNGGDRTVNRVLVEAFIQDAGSLGDPDRHEMVLGPFAPGERQDYEDLVTYLLPSGQDARGNEVFEFSYDLKVVSVE